MKKITIEKMETIEGGVPVAEYCATLCMIMTYNPVTYDMISNFNTYCGNYYC